MAIHVSGLAILVLVLGATTQGFFSGSPERLQAELLNEADCECQVTQIAHPIVASGTCDLGGGAEAQCFTLSQSNASPPEDGRCQQQPDCEAQAKGCTYSNMTVTVDMSDCAAQCLSGNKARPQYSKIGDSEWLNDPNGDQSPGTCVEYEYGPHNVPSVCGTAPDGTRFRFIDSSNNVVFEFQYRYGCSNPCVSDPF